MTYKEEALYILEKIQAIDPYLELIYFTRECTMSTWAWMEMVLEDQRKHAVWKFPMVDHFCKKSDLDKVARWEVEFNYLEACYQSMLNYISDPEMPEKFWQRDDPETCN